MERIINSHNLKIMKEKSPEQHHEPCNCEMGINTCPLEGKCQTSAVVYQATVSTGDGEIKTYTGCTAGTFKKRYYGHVADMRDREMSKTQN